MTEQTTALLPADAVSAPDRTSLLRTLASVAAKQAVVQLDGFMARLAERLAAQTDGDVQVCRAAARQLNENRAAFRQLAQDSLRQALQRAVHATAEQASSLESGALDLSLSTFDAMERKVQIDNLSQVLDAENAEALAALGLRLAHCLQREENPLAQNPFRAETFLKAISDAWRKFDANGAHRIVMRQMLPDTFLQLAPVLQAVNRELVVRNVLPDAEERCRRRPTASAVPSFRNRLQEWLTPPGSAGIDDGRAAALFDRLFDVLLRDAAVSASTADSMRQLHDVLRQCALTDKDFFFTSRHPARRFVHALVDAGLACVDAQASVDPVRTAITQAVASVSGSGPRRDALEAAVGDLAACMAQQEQKLVPRLREAIAEAMRKDSLLHVQMLAEDEIASRIEGGEVPGFLEIFLQTQWLRVLAFAYDISDTRPETLPKVLQTMDDLVWSVQPKSDPDQRRELTMRLPSLLAVLNAWLNIIKWEGEERAAFFSTLAERHAAALRAPADLAPRQQLEVRMNALQKASEHHLSRRALEQQEEALALFLQQVDSLATGSWIEFVRNNGTRVNCRLEWISASRSRFVFAGQQGRLLFSLTDEFLAQGLRAERVKIVAADGVIERALAAALEAPAAS